MTKEQFNPLFHNLFTGLGSRPVAGQADVWYQTIRDRGFSYAIVAQAVERLIAASRTSRPLPKDLIAECSKVAVNQAEYQRKQGNDEERQEAESFRSGVEGYINDKTDDYQRSLFNLAGRRNRRELSYDEFAAEFEKITGKTVDSVLARMSR